LRQFFAGLLARIYLSDALLVLALGVRRTAKAACQIARGAERNREGVDAPGQPADATASAAGLELSTRHPGVEQSTDIDTGGNELVARSFDVGGDQVDRYIAIN
jgi:hypothetical protein